MWTDLGLDLPDVALSQVRSGGRLLVDDKDSLGFAQILWYYADTRGSQTLKTAARTLYLQAKPIAFVYHGEPIDTSRHHDYYSVLRAWSEVAPFFEATQDLIKQVNALQFNIDERREEVSQASIKCGLRYGALLTVLKAGLELEVRDALLQTLKAMEQPDWYFAALLAIARRDSEAVSTTDLKAAYADCATNDDFRLALAKYLYSTGDHDGTNAFVSGLAHIRFDALQKGHALGFSDTTFTMDLRCLQELLAMPEGPVPGVQDDNEEALARIESAARQLGIMLAAATTGKTVPDLRGSFRSILLFHNRRVSLPEYDRRKDYLLTGSKEDVYTQLSRVARAFGIKGMEALRDTVLEITAGDGAQKKIAYSALQRVAQQEAITRAREHFGRDLFAGRLSNYYLTDDITNDIVELFQFLELSWPSDGVLEAVGSYLDEVLAANQKVEPYRSLSDSKILDSADEALCRFLVYLLGFPVVDIGIAARRCLAKYVEQDGRSLARVLLAERCWDGVQLEHMLVALHVGSLKNPRVLDLLREFIIGLNRHESIAVRGIARRICQEQGWAWTEIHDMPPPKLLLIPTFITAQTTLNETRMLIEGDVAVAADLHRPIFRILEGRGNDHDELASEFTRLYAEIEQTYAWKDDVRLRRWMKMALARFWLNPRAIMGREAAMMLLGRRALSGQAPHWAEQAYDALYPLYDPALELIEPRERPPEMLAMNWEFRGERGKDWLQGKEATDWDHYPSSVGGLHLIAERSWFIRPDWEWPREERYRGVLIDSEGDDVDRESLASGYELTFQGYLRGDAQERNQLIVWNSERQLVGPQYRWMAMNSNVARELGWTLCPTNPFEWRNSAGHSMVKSVYWKDGWIWLEPPRFEALGEGWYILASDLAVEAIRRAFPDAQIHLWVERHSHGAKPYNGTWHLRQPF